MSTIYQPNAYRLLSGPFSFSWTDVTPAGNVIVDGIKPNLAAVAGGEQFTLSRGSTAQFNQLVTVAAPGGGAGTKTLNELVNDINGVFGAGFAQVWNNHLRLKDANAGPNFGAVGTGDYVGANDAAKNDLFSRIGIPTGISRQVTAAPSTTRVIDYAFEPDNVSGISSTYFPLPTGTREVILAVRCGVAAASTILPIVGAFFSDGASFEPPYSSINEANVAEGIYSPALSQSTQARPVATSNGVIVETVVVGTDPVTSNTILRVPAAPIWTRLRCAIPGIVDAGSPVPSWRSTPTLSVIAWAVG